MPTPMSMGDAAGPGSTTSTGGGRRGGGDDEAFFCGGFFGLAFLGSRSGVEQLHVGPAAGRFAGSEIGVAAGAGGGALCGGVAAAIMSRARFADCARLRARSRSLRAVSVRSLLG